jgi:hypothetical protein
MGAWGEGVFDNDTAGDWTDQFEGNPPTSLVVKAVNAACKSKNLPEEVCSVALAASEVIAASRGRPCPDFPTSIKAWIMKKPFRADDVLARLAIACLDRIATRSELAELWEYESTWQRGLAALKKRLALPPKEPRYRVPTSKPASSFKAAKTMVEEELSGRLTAPRNAEMYLRFHGALTDEQFIRLLDLHVEVLQPVQTLELRFKGISDRTLEKLHLLPNLTVLYLLGSSVTDAGMPYLSNLPNLRELELDATRVSDKGLLELAGSPQLLCLAIGKTKVTPKGIKEFQRKMPNCFVGPTWEWAAHLRRFR